MMLGLNVLWYLNYFVISFMFHICKGNYRSCLSRNFRQCRTIYSDGYSLALSGDHSIFLRVPENGIWLFSSTCEMLIQIFDSQ